MSDSTENSNGPASGGSESYMDQTLRAGDELYELLMSSGFEDVTTEEHEKRNRRVFKFRPAKNHPFPKTVTIEYGERIVLEIGATRVFDGLDIPLPLFVEFCLTRSSIPYKQGGLM